MVKEVKTKSDTFYRVIENPGGRNYGNYSNESTAVKRASEVARNRGVTVEVVKVLGSVRSQQPNKFRRKRD